MFWTYQGTPVKQPPDCAHSFVYEITNTISGRKYIGKKSLRTSQIKRKAGQRNKRVIKESDWRNYWGSNKELLEDIQYYGHLNFTREILHWCKTKGTANYLELKEQILYGVLEHPDLYYNNFIGARIHRKHLKLDFINDMD